MIIKDSIEKNSDRQKVEETESFVKEYNANSLFYYDTLGKSKLSDVPLTESK